MRKKHCEHIWEEKARSETVIYYKCARCGELRAVERKGKKDANSAL